MIPVIWSVLSNNPIARAIAKIGGVIFAVLTMRALWKRDGRKEAEAEHKAEAAEADQKAHERMNDADLGIGATDGERIERLRDFAAKHGDRQAKREGR